MLAIYRLHWIKTLVVILLTIVACVFAIGLGVQYIWDAKEANAVTEAEWADVTADTAELFFHVVFGFPFALTYTILCYLAASLVSCIYRLISNRLGSKIRVAAQAKT